MKYIVIMIVFLLVFSCQKNDKLNKLEKNDKVITMNSLSDYDCITSSVKSKGDTLAYNELYYYLMDSNEADRTDTLMYYSKIMAEKYNYELAYFYYFSALCEKNNIPFKDGNYSTINTVSMNKNSREQMQHWLKKMLERKVITKQQYDSVRK